VDANAEKRNETSQGFDTGAENINQVKTQKNPRKEGPNVGDPYVARVMEQDESAQKHGRCFNWVKSDEKGGLTTGRTEPRTSLRGGKKRDNIEWETKAVPA